MGPLFFLIFYNDLAFSVNCSVDAYADDSTMTVSAGSVEEIGNQLTENCKLVSDWMLGNKLKLNPEKTHLLTVGTGARLRNQNSKVVVKMDGMELKESSSEALLGCWVEPNLKWHKQVNALLTKLQTRLAALQKLQNVIPVKSRKTIAEGIFTSVLSYCLPVFGGCDKGEIEAIQILQNKAARIVVSAGMRTDRRQLLSRVGWMSVVQLIYYHTALCTFRIRRSKEPEYLHNIMNTNNRADKIIVPNSTLSLAMKSYCFRGANDWNRLPENIRNCPRISSFKQQLKGWIFKNVPQFYD